MFASVTQAVLTVLVCAAAFLYVLTRGARNQLRAPLLCILAFIVLWMGGKLAIDMSSSLATARVWMLMSYLGACGLAPAWVWLAARFARSPLIARHPEILAGLCVPTSLFYLALLTNDGHRLFARVVTLEAFQEGPRAFAGPLFWWYLGWQIAVVSLGVVFFAADAIRSATPRKRTHATLMLLAGLFPVMATLSRYFGVFPFDFDPIPPSIGIAVAAIIGIAIRHRLLDLLPLARRDVIDALADAVVLGDADGNILDANPVATMLLGAPLARLRDQSITRAFTRLVPEDDVASTSAALELAMTSSDASTVNLRTASGRDLELRSDTVRNYQDEPSGRFVLVRDVTEMRRYERMLRESQQRVIVGGLAAGLAHEVNNPLAFVASNLHQIHRVAGFEPAELEPFPKQRAAELSELPEVVAETIEGVERIAQIVRRILRPGRLDAADVIRLDLASVIADAVRLVEFHGQYPVPMQVAPLRDLPAVDGSPERLSQALLNLLLNAQQVAEGFSDARVQVEAATDPGGVVVRIGIHDEDGHPFGGVLPPVAPAGSSAEAELSAAYEIVRQHGGSLEAGGDRSALFALRLPRAG